MDRLMERQLDAGRGRAARAGDGGARRRGPARAQHGRRSRRRAASRLRFAGERAARADLVVISVGIRPADRRSRAPPGSTCERGIVVDDAHAHVATRACSPSASARSTAASSTASSRRSTSRRRSPRTRSAAIDAAYDGLDPDGEAQGHGRRPRLAPARPTATRAVVVADDAQLPQARRRPRRPRPSARSCSATSAAPSCCSTPCAPAASRRRPARAARRGVAGRPPPTCPTAPSVCNCNGVCKGEIVDAIRDARARLHAEVVAVTRAGAGCGSCKPLVGELLAIERGGAAEEPTYLCPCRSQTREELAAVVRERRARVGLRASPPRAAPAATAAPASPALAYLVSRDQRQPPPRGAPRALHQRPRPREHPERRHVLASSRGCAAA